MLREMTKSNGLPAGFTTRPATLEDAKLITDLANTCSLAYTGKEEMTVNGMESYFGTPGLDIAASTHLTFSPEGKLVGYMDVDDARPLPVKIDVWGRTHPDYEGLGIASAGLAWAEARAYQTLERLPDDLRVVMTCGTLNINQKAAKLFQTHDMEVVRHFQRMVIELDKPLPQAVWPDGITITSYAEFGDLAALYQAEEDAFRDHWGYIEEPEEEGLKHLRHWIETDEEFEPGLWFLAMDDDEIAGFSLCRRRSYSDEEMGWVNVLGVRRPWRKQGLGLALLHHSFNVFQKRGKKRAGLGVDAESLTGATRLYEKAGMRVFRQSDVYQKVLRDGKDIVKQSLEE